MAKKKTKNNRGRHGSGAHGRPGGGRVSIDLNLLSSPDLLGSLHRPVENLSSQAFKGMERAQGHKAVLSLKKLEIQQRGPLRSIQEQVHEANAQAVARQKEAQALADKARAEAAQRTEQARAEALAAQAKARMEADKQQAELRQRLVTEQQRFESAQRVQEKDQRKRMQEQQDAIELQQVDMQEKAADAELKMAEQQVQMAAQMGASVFGMAGIGGFGSPSRSRGRQSRSHTVR